MFPAERQKLPSWHSGGMYMIQDEFDTAPRETQGLEWSCVELILYHVHRSLNVLVDVPCRMAEVSLRRRWPLCIVLPRHVIQRRQQGIWLGTLSVCPISRKEHAAVGSALHCVSREPHLLHCAREPIAIHDDAFATCADTPEQDFLRGAPRFRVVRCDITDDSLEVQVASDEQILLDCCACMRVSGTVWNADAMSVVKVWVQVWARTEKFFTLRCLLPIAHVMLARMSPAARTLWSLRGSTSSAQIHPDSAIINIIATATTIHVEDPGRRAHSAVRRGVIIASLSTIHAPASFDRWPLWKQMQMQVVVHRA